MGTNPDPALRQSSKSQATFNLGSALMEAVNSHKEQKLKGETSPPAVMRTLSPFSPGPRGRRQSIVFAGIPAASLTEGRTRSPPPTKSGTGSSQVSSFVVLHPFDQLTRKEVNLAEICYTEHVLGRRRLKLDNYIARRCEFLKENIAIQRKGIASRDSDMLRLREVEKAKVSFLREKRVVQRMLDYHEEGRGLQLGRKTHGKAPSMMAGHEVLLTAHVDDLGQASKAGMLEQIRKYRRAVRNDELKSGVNVAKVERAKLVCNEYIMRVHAEGGGVDVKLEARRLREYNTSAANMLQKMWRVHLFRTYIWAMHYLRQRHHVYQLFNRCIPDSKKPKDLKSTNAMPFLRDSHCKDEAHLTANKVPLEHRYHTHDSIVPLGGLNRDERVNVAMVTKLMIDLELPMSLTDIRDAVLDLDKMSHEAAMSALHYHNSQVANIYNQMKHPVAGVDFETFVVWWAKVLPRPMSPIVMVRLVRAAMRQHTREIFARTSASKINFRGQRRTALTRGSLEAVRSSATGSTPQTPPTTDDSVAVRASAQGTKKVRRARRNGRSRNISHFDPRFRYRKPQALQPSTNSLKSQIPSLCP